MRYLPEGLIFASTGILRANSSKRSKERAKPARFASAIKCTAALVEPDKAKVVITALSKELAVRISEGFKSSHAISTMRRPVNVAICACLESGAGIEAYPDKHKPSASTVLVMVDAVPIVMQ